METMQITVPVKANATNTEIATALRWRANLFDGMDPKAACSVPATQTPVVGKASKAAPATASQAAAPEASDEDDDFGKAEQKTKTTKAAKQAAAAFEDEGDDAGETEAETETAETEDEGDFMEAAPAKTSKKSTAKKYTVNDVNDACKAKAAATDRKTVLGILKKKFNVASVTELKADQYADVIKAMAV